ncbi:MOSC N-terminal beta barrel domain-containing protein [Thiomicrospira microaerophila]|uniref:MOSC domain-containing protein n=1 Tax=Thiomicrospira microaerophila TaxID=406020 RepID=UPI00200BD54E|nr:MOSC N-terminal beta barrel domain-containing protein [Thiomicrospira microaerophila]UQB41362.1 MOSC N-terminal beta barrel domain-containing protein [Thiomicrospira microaerophila]
MMWLSEIWRYPIKSCGGESLDQTELDPFGLQGDRRWMLIDQYNRMVTQRQHPKMGLIRVKTQQAEGLNIPPGLVVSAPGFKDLAIQLPNQASVVEVGIWQDSCQAWLADFTVHQWFSDFLGQAVRLVWFPDSGQRQIDLNYAKVGEQVAFADGFPLLLTSQASLDDLNQRLSKPIEMIRFRPNLVVSGCQAFDEDRHQQLRIGSKRFILAKPCSRCAIPSLDPKTALKQTEVSRALAYRQAEAGVLFGQNLCYAPDLHQRLKIESVVIRLGDEICWSD